MEEEISALENRKRAAGDLDMPAGGGLPGLIGFLASFRNS
jgi:hypothetical protein